MQTMLSTEAASYLAVFASASKATAQAMEGTRAKWVPIAPLTVRLKIPLANYS